MKNEVLDLHVPVRPVPRNTAYDTYPGQLPI